MPKAHLDGTQSNYAALRLGFLPFFLILISYEEYKMGAPDLVVAG